MTIKILPPLSEQSFLYMKILASRFGIDLSNYKQDALYNHLIKRLRYLQLSDFDSYCQKLRFDLDEEVHFINLITNQTTYFFREKHHFDYLARKVIPELIAAKNKIRIWSAGCSTGEEAYSIAMILFETIPNIKQYDIKILATDINSDSLITAEKGVYELGHISKMSNEYQLHWFDRAPDPTSSLVQVKPELKELISFAELNLIDPWPMQGLFDVIFCRNVIIYFKKTIRNQILHKFHRYLNVHGLLFLGYSENIMDLKNHYQLMGNTIFQKKSD